MNKFTCGLLFVIILFGISFFGTAGIIKLITICIGCEFSWRLSTTIWLLLVLLGQAFGKN